MPLKSRLGVEEVDGKFVTRILDAEGKPTALTVDEFKKEFGNRLCLYQTAQANFQQQSKFGQEINLTILRPCHN